MATDENPYAPPKASERVIGVNSGRREDLKIVAVIQKLIIVCIPLNVAAIAAQLLVPPEWTMLLVDGLLILFVVQTVSVVILATKVFNTLTGIVYGIGTIVPCLGLLILLTINGKANEILTKNGHRVGLFGADLSEF
jgi:hypothetical protein